MEIIAKAKFIRIGPRKLRLMAKGLCGQNPQKALSALPFEGKRGDLLARVLRQAVANAKNNFSLSDNDLKIKKVDIDSGSIYKRFRPISQGRAHPIKKRTSHITVVLEAKEGEKNGTKN